MGSSRHHRGRLPEHGSFDPARFLSQALKCTSASQTLYVRATGKSQPLAIRAVQLKDQAGKIEGGLCGYQDRYGPAPRAAHGNRSLDFRNQAAGNSVS